ncbi:MAG: Methionyl-tRNA formyltransferase, partial [uncultured Craurococcus sp.]
AHRRLHPGERPQRRGGGGLPPRPGRERGADRPVRSLPPGRGWAAGAGLAASPPLRPAAAALSRGELRAPSGAGPAGPVRRSGRRGGGCERAGHGGRHPCRAAGPAGLAAFRPDLPRRDAGPRAPGRDQPASFAAAAAPRAGANRLGAERAGALLRRLGAPPGAADRCRRHPRPAGGEPAARHHGQRRRPRPAPGRRAAAGRGHRPARRGAGGSAPALLPFPAARPAAAPRAARAATGRWRGSPPCPPPRPEGV